MATNIRFGCVVEPGRTAEYDRISRVSPFLVLVAGITLASVFAISAITSNLGDVGMVTMLLLAAVVGTATLVATIRFANATSVRRDAISRELEPLRSIVVFDEEAVTDEALWEAAGVAIKCEELEDATDRIAYARFRTLEQERVYLDRESALHEMGQRILSLVA